MRMTPLKGDKVIQSFESEGSLMSVEHSERVNTCPVRIVDQSEEWMNIISFLGISKIKLLFSFFIFIFFNISSLSAISSISSEDYITKRVYAHIVIGDYPSACAEARSGIIQQPNSKLLREAFIRSLAKAGEEKEMIAQWHFYIQQWPEEVDNRDILECLAWAVIGKGATSSSPVIRVIAMLGAFFSQDAKGVALLREGLQDENSFLRMAAIKLASNLHDVCLQEELLRLIKSEPLWEVRLAAIKAVGNLQLRDARSTLEEVIIKNNTHLAEKAVAIEALVMMADEISQERIQELVKSDRVGLRLLACEFIAYFEQTQDVDLLYPLLQDHHSSVRAKVFQVLGAMRVRSMAGQPVEILASKGTLDPDPLVQANAAWVLTLSDPQSGLEVFQKLLQHNSRETRYLASAALAATGRYGLPLMKEVFKTNGDPYIKMNLALGIIGQRVEITSCSDCLFSGLSQLNEKWDWRHEGQFRILSPSKVKHDDTIPNNPEAVNQLTLLEVLEVLSIVQYPHAQQAIKKFLQQSNWGISGLASVLLLTEGDDTAVEHVKVLLSDPDAKVRVQAALILSLWGKGDDAVLLLQDAYQSADRELKGQILEGIGRIGSQSSLGFLAERLQEPYQTQRIIAAAALLECLYH